MVDCIREEQIMLRISNKEIHELANGNTIYFWIAGVEYKIMTK